MRVELICAGTELLTGKLNTNISYIGERLSSLGLDLTTAVTVGDNRELLLEACNNSLKNNKIKHYKIYPVPDLYNDKKWVDYIKNNLPKYDFVYSGNPWTLRCFKRHDSKVKKIRLIRGVSSTIIRDKMIKNKNWQSLVPKDIADYIKNIDGIERIKNISKS